MKYEDIRRQVLTAIRQASAQGLIHGLTFKTADKI